MPPATRTWRRHCPAASRSSRRPFRMVASAPVTSWPRFGAARAPSPDVRYGHPVLRSLDADCAPASCLRWSATPALGARPAPHGCSSQNSQPRRDRGGNRWPRFGAARAPSPDVRYGHAVLRSLDADCAPASCLRWSATPALGARPAPHGCSIQNSQPQRDRGGNRWPRFGAARAPSPDVRYGHPVLRSLDADCAPASCLRWSATPALGARPAPHGFRIRNSQFHRARGRMPNPASGTIPASPEVSRC